MDLAGFPTYSEPGQLGLDLGSVDAKFTRTSDPVLDIVLVRQVRQLFLAGTPGKQQTIEQESEQQAYGGNDGDQSALDPAAVKREPLPQFEQRLREEKQQNTC